MYRLGEYMKGLVIEDDIGINQMIVNSLKTDFNFDSVFSAVDGALAIDKLKTYKIDFIVVDINIPKISGLQLLKAIREEAGDCGIMLISASLDARAAQIASDFNVDIMLPKPFDRGMFMEKIEDYLKIAS
jgi:two-component system chemotaxis response regulator CheY